jgi:nitrite reductase (NADH) small subunit
MNASGRHWVDIGPENEFPLNAVREIIAGGLVLAVARLEDGYYAIDGLCPHQGGPLGQGKLADNIVICPWHQFSFDMKTGHSTSSAHLCQSRFEVRAQAGRVVVQIEGD